MIMQMVVLITQCVVFLDVLRQLEEAVVIRSLFW